MFKKSSKKDGLPWYLVGFFKETDKQFTMHFSQIPQLASYFDNVKDLIYDSSLELTLKKEHIIDDNIERLSKRTIQTNDLSMYCLMLQREL